MAVLYFVLIVKLKLGDTCTTSYMVHEWADSNGEMERFREEQEERNKRASLMGREGHWEILQRCEVEAKRKGDEQK